MRPKQHECLVCVCLERVAKTETGKLGGKHGLGRASDVFSRLLESRKPKVSLPVEVSFTLGITKQSHKVNWSYPNLISLPAPSSPTDK